ncbi:hypothetical protein J437_LFUL018429 [Ladona fulva]|uniref:PiggyBac transposable element-derived protein domain-containing protein n=1 Tax=Ladona fulva TaxID=123851 RepID=A0A8K0KWY6_LADFU|nr:hypothetical protein J437_LFUL018429 [Ladona fulva]
MSSGSDSDDYIEDRSELDVVKYISDEAEEEITKDFVWEDIVNYVGNREEFIGGHGPQNEAKDMNDLVTYAVKRGNILKKSRIASWRAVTVEEIYTVLGIFMLMGIIQKPTIRSYFSTKIILSTPGFSDVISRDRLEIICKYLHFSDNEAKDYSGPSKLRKIFPVIFHLNSNLKKYYLPSRDISIDESLCSARNIARAGDARLAMTEDATMSKNNGSQRTTGVKEQPESKNNRQSVNNQQSEIGKTVKEQPESKQQPETVSDKKARFSRESDRPSQSRG